MAFNTTQKYFKCIFTPSQFCYDIFSKYLDVELKKINITSPIHKYLDLLDNYSISNDAIIIQKNYINFITDISGGKIFSKIIFDYLKIYPVNDNYCKILKQKLLNLCIL